MADTVTTSVVFQGEDKVLLRLTNRSDATGETGVTKMDISTYPGPLGVASTFTCIWEIQWSIQGFGSVQLYWDHTTDDTIEILGAGNGYRDYRDVNGLFDPRSAGGTGDILLSTFAPATGATYDIALLVGLRN